MTDRESVLVDTNILVAAIDEARSGHRHAVEFLANDERELIVTAQVIREFLAVATRPMAANGLGLSGAMAEANLDDLLIDVEIYADSGAAMDVLRGFVGREMAAGKQIHDAALVAQALHHRLDVIVTDNCRHFERFADLITIEPLVEED